jgi:predicted ATPase
VISNADGSDRERLTRLRVSGFKSIRELDLEVNDLMVLVGANGSGKSNLIQLLALLSFVPSEQARLFVLRGGGAASMLHYGPKVTKQISVELHAGRRDRMAVYRCALEFSATDELLFSSEALESRMPRRKGAKVWPLQGAGHETALTEATESGDQRLRAAAQTVRQRLSGIRSYHFHDTSDSARIRTRQDLYRSHSLMEEGENLAAFLYSLQRERPHHYAQVLTTLRLVVPYLETLTLDPEPLSPGQILLRWRDRSGDEFGPHQLSDGSLRAIALTTALLQPNELLPAIIVIDEPELGLHPSAVGVVGALIRAASTRTQVVVATQSPRLLAEFRPQDVVVVERREDELRRGYSSFQRLSTEALGTWLDEYDLGALYEMNITGGGPE